MPSGSGDDESGSIDAIKGERGKRGGKGVWELDSPQKRGE